jgi:hypothetical protein
VSDLLTFLLSSIGFILTTYSVFLEYNVLIQHLPRDEEEQQVPLDHIDKMDLGGASRQHKIKLIDQELGICLKEHEVLMENWSANVVWLWNRCQPLTNKPHISMWLEKFSGINWAR